MMRDNSRTPSGSGKRRVMRATGRIDTREAHGSRGDPVHPNPRGQDFLVRDVSHALRRYRDPMPPRSQGVREVENVALLAADVRWEELSEQQDTHQCATRPMLPS